MLVSGQIAVVTGASRGIGEAVAKLFCDNGATVINGDLCVPPAPELVKRMQGATGAIYEGHLNVADKESVDGFIDQVLKQFGRIDILVNNAGICPPMISFETVTNDEWHKVFDVNVMGTVNCTNKVIPLMMEQKYGKIINTSSIAGEIGGKVSSVAYSSSKASIVTMTKVLARQLAPYGVNVNAISPGYIITEMTKDHVVDVTMIPMGRRGDAREVANTVLFLASELSSYITGATIGVNGGVHMK